MRDKDVPVPGQKPTSLGRIYLRKLQKYVHTCSMAVGSVVDLPKDVIKSDRSDENKDIEGN